MTANAKPEMSDTVKLERFYTLETLEVWRRKHAEALAAFAGGECSDSDKKLAGIEEARLTIELIESVLKMRGVILKTEEELTNERLDREFQAAHGRAPERGERFTDGEGVAWMSRHSPRDWSLTGSVKAWDRTWVRVRGGRDEPESHRGGAMLADS